MHRCSQSCFIIYISLSYLPRHSSCVWSCGILQGWISLTQHHATWQHQIQLMIQNLCHRLWHFIVSRTSFPSTDCDMDSCINYFICNNKQEYLIYFYSEKDSRQSEKSHILSDIWKNDQHLDDLREKTYFTEDQTKACFFVILFDLTNMQEITSQNSHDVEAAIYALPHWNNTGINNVILFLTDNQQNQDFLWDINTKKAIVAQTAFKKETVSRRIWHFNSTCCALKTEAKAQLSSKELVEGISEANASIQGKHDRNAQLRWYSSQWYR